ncbi:MAG: prolyl oligopeptidase family serine peptidase [Candidatus Cloacimonetes bacterium]|nr:prolyl oligopeptidase family serine peptidase [Candidatus Cloacimonadota bacterium]
MKKLKDKGKIMKYPKTEKRPVVETLHGKKIKDDYRWLENDESDEVKEWDKEQNKFTREYLDKLPQREWLLEKFNELGRYDSVGSIRRLKKTDRIFQYQKKKEEDKYVVYTAENDNAQMVEFINPNKWEEDETLAFFKSTEDGKLVAFGKTKGGDEAPVIHIMEVESRKILSDKMKGWRQTVFFWLPDNSGFYYVCCPLKGEVPAGEEYYWRTVYLHKLGTDSKEDVKIWWDDEVKEKWTAISLTHDNKYEILMKSIFYKDAFWIKKFGSDKFSVITDDFDAEYRPDYYKGKLYILTNKDTPNYKIYITNVENPGKENWQEFIPETEYKITNFAIISGRIFVTYLENVHTQIKIFDFAGNYLRNVTLPMLGTAMIYGEEDGKDTWVWFSSFSYPDTIFIYDFENNQLEEFFRPPMDIDLENIQTDQVWYKSKDGTSIPMFLIYNKKIKRDRNNSVLLNGYGGFNVSMDPYFSLAYTFWIENGGILAIANLRGGGEFGEKWHQAGMKDKKQNVFDDFIAAAEWLIEEKYIRPEKLIVSGGSNGGLLIGAIVTQRPDLMKAALCQVPLLDMIRYHHSSIANIWKEEYGSAENPDEFEYLLKYSPCHNVKDDEHYPTMLITTGINDARVDPFHARKFVALLQDKIFSENSIYLLVQDSSGHGGGTTLSIQFEQWSDYYAFLMDQVGMEVSEEKE